MKGIGNLKVRLLINRSVPSSSSYELFVVSIMQEDTALALHCVSAHTRFASLQLDWGHHDG